MQNIKKILFIFFLETFAVTTFLVFLYFVILHSIFLLQSRVEIVKNLVLSTDSFRVSPPIENNSEPEIIPETIDENEEVFKFINFGDWGNFPEGDFRIFSLMNALHEQKGFTDIFTNGDNNYGTFDTFDQFVDLHLGPMLAKGVDLHMSLGNHDVESDEKMQNQITNERYGEWNCELCLEERPDNNQNRYYSLSKGAVRFIILDSDLLIVGDTQQEEWLSRELDSSVTKGEPWRFLIFHHPVFSSGRHGATDDFRERYIPLFVEKKVDVVLSGHDHFYERAKISSECGSGVYYIVNGGIYLRPGDSSTNECVAKVWDESQSFMYFQITKNKILAQVINAEGQLVDTWEKTK